MSASPAGGIGHQTVVAFTRELFNENVKAICERSKQIGDTFELLAAAGDQNGLYLEKKDQQMIRGDVHTFVYDIIYSDSFTCPVLYLNVYQSNGRTWSYKDVYGHFKLASDGEDEMKNVDALVLTQQEHPYLSSGRPFYYLHPCRTLDWMRASRVVDHDDERTSSSSSSLSSGNPTLKWLSFTFSALGIPLSLQYALPAV
jgi:hypothetical protein